MGLLAVIPARRGSKGLPGKNTKPFAGLPLIAHSILFAKMCSEIERCIVTTDDQGIAELARSYGADVPFMRPPELAEDSSPLFPVVRHALLSAERQDHRTYDFVLLLDPTSPAREPEDVSLALEKLTQYPEADGIVSVSRPDFNPIWHCVVDRDGWMSNLMPEGFQFERRQDVPAVYRINGAIYIWRADFVRTLEGAWRQSGRHLMLEIPESRAMSIDTIEEFQRAECLVTGGLIRLPWMN